MKRNKNLFKQEKTNDAYFEIEIGGNTFFAISFSFKVICQY